MANTNNNAGITSDEIQKTKEYKDALDNLSNSLTGVTSKLPAFADGVDAGLKAIAEKLPEVVEAMTKFNAQNKDLVANGQKPINIFSQLASSLLSWNNLVSVGITLLATYGGTIIKWVGEMIKGETTLSALNKALKDNKLVADAVNRSKMEGTVNAQKELVHLKLLYNATQDKMLSDIARKKAMDALQGQYPQYFKNLSTETSKADDVKKAYNSLTDAIIASARARAAEDMIEKNQTRRLGDEQKLADLKAKRIKIEKELKEVQESNKKINNMQVLGGSSFTVGTGSKDTGGDAKISRLSAEANAIKKEIEDLRTDTRILDRQNDALTDSIEKAIKKHGISVIENTNTGTGTKGTPKTLQPKEVLEAMSITFSKQIELDKQHYDAEQALLQGRLDKKLISQEIFNKESDALLEKYHLAIGEKISIFNEKEQDAVVENMQAVVAAQKQKYGVADSNSELQDEERKQQAITELTKRHEEERKEFVLQTSQKVSDAAFGILKGSIQSQADAKIKGLETQKQAELANTNLTAGQRKAIEDKYKKREAEEKVKAFKAEQRASILQAVINGALAITKVTSQTGVLSPFVIPGIIAETAIQVAAIAKQKAPQYAKGGLHYQSDGRGALLSGYSRMDDTNAYLRSGEAVVVSEAMRNPWARNLVSAINVAYGGRDFSVTNPGRGYAIGGIYTDGGNANRYYNQPVNDVKDLANTVAYQMINNFPPIYVDVKDVNNQQNILAQTVNRVNL